MGFASMGWVCLARDAQLDRLVALEGDRLDDGSGGMTVRPRQGERNNDQRPGPAGVVKVGGGRFV